MEWKTILTIAENNGYTIDITHDLKTKLILRKQKQKQQEKIVPRKKRVIFPHFSPLVRRVTSPFRQTNLKEAFPAINTIQQQLTEKQTYNNPSGIYKLKCNTRNGVYVGQSGGTINLRYKEHIRCIRTNNSAFAFVVHILENRHEYGTKEKAL